MQRLERRLDNKVAVVVGGATGFGLATSKRFAEEGATVVVVGRRGDLASEVGEALGGSGFACDITDFDQLDQVTAHIVATYGRIDAAVNYAGYQQRVELKDLTPERLRSMVDVQLVAAIWFIRAMAEAMRAGGGGSIISTSSLTAQNPSAGQVAYAASKKGLEYATEIAAVEYGPVNVRVNCIAAHLIETPMTAEIFENKLVVEAVKQQTPMGRMGTVDDIANAALFLASDEANYISGQTLCVDGAASTQKLPTANDYALVAKANPNLLS
jgi:NAD(P)-dependent dehydrogenase (short-subunit alcohol dehydrogenase family)